MTSASFHKHNGCSNPVRHFEEVFLFRAIFPFMTVKCCKGPLWCPFLRYSMLALPNSYDGNGYFSFLFELHKEDDV